MFCWAQSERLYKNIAIIELAWKGKIRRSEVWWVHKILDGYWRREYACYWTRLVYLSIIKIKGLPFLLVVSEFLRTFVSDGWITTGTLLRPNAAPESWVSNVRLAINYSKVLNIRLKKTLRSIIVYCCAQGGEMRLSRASWIKNVVVYTKERWRGFRGITEKCA